MSEKAGLSIKKSESKEKGAVSSSSKTGLSQAMEINSPVEQVLHLQRTIGNKAVTRLIQSGVLQAKLKIGQPDDIYEQEAYRLAEHVLRMRTPDPEGNEIIRREPDSGDTKVTEEEKAELELGRKLWQDFPAGVTVAFYDRHEPVAVNRSSDWSKRENAIASKGKTISAKNLVFGKAFPDSFDIKTTLPALGKVLTSAITRAGQPQNIQPLPGTGPSRIRLFAIFSHGIPGWLGIGSNITKRNVTSLIKAIAPNLTTDVNVILYACSSARAPSEKESWYKGTMKPGGAKSIGGLIRDALLAEGAKHSTVWGHQTVGHATTNFALRIFYATGGKGSEGESYVEQFALGVVEEIIALGEVEDEIAKKGYTIESDQMEAFIGEVYRRLSGNGLKSLFYKCYAQANKNKKYRGVNLAEMAPVDPLGVANVIQQYWENDFWPGEKTKLADDLIKKLKLKKESATE